MSNPIAQIARSKFDDYLNVLSSDAPVGKRAEVANQLETLIVEALTAARTEAMGEAECKCTSAGHCLLAAVNRSSRRLATTTEIQKASDDFAALPFSRRIAIEIANLLAEARLTMGAPETMPVLYDYADIVVRRHLLHEPSALVADERTIEPWEKLWLMARAVYRSWHPDLDVALIDAQWGSNAAKPERDRAIALARQCLADLLPSPPVSQQKREA